MTLVWTKLYNNDLETAAEKIDSKRGIKKAKERLKAPANKIELLKRMPHKLFTIIISNNQGNRRTTAGKLTRIQKGKLTLRTIEPLLKNICDALDEESSTWYS